MRVFAMILAAALTVAQVGSARALLAQQSAPAKAIEAKLIAAEHAAWAAWVSRDTAAYLRDLDRHEVMLDNTGRSTLDVGELARVMATCRLTSHKLDSLKSTQLTPDVVVLTYRAAVQGTCAGKPLPQVWASSIWVKRGSRWIGVFHTEAPVAPSGG